MVTVWPTLPDERQRVSASVREFYHEQVDTDDWRVLRAVALAVAYELNDPGLIVDWIDRIAGSPGMVEANLAMTDAYYNGKRPAIETYLGRVRGSFRIRSAGRIWEVFYLGRRATKHDADVLTALAECRDHTADAALRRVADEAFKLLTS